MDTINDNNSVLLVLKLYNNSKVVAQNVQIVINEDWLTKLDEIESEVGQKSIKILKALSSKKDIYITERQEHTYFIISKFKYKELSDIPLIIKINYHKKNGNIIKKQSETFKINMESIGGKLSNPSEVTCNLINTISKLEEINNNLEEIKANQKRTGFPLYPSNYPLFKR